jgi:hypothetical protein
MDGAEHLAARSSNSTMRARKKREVFNLRIVHEIKRKSEDRVATAITARYADNVGRIARDMADRLTW